MEKHIKKIPLLVKRVGFCLYKKRIRGDKQKIGILSPAKKIAGVLAVYFLI
jgi:hypothetical protein